MISPRSRRWALAPAVAMTALLALSACGSSDDESESNAEGAVAEEGTGLLPAAEGSTQYPLTLTTWAGETVLEERPERVAVIGFNPNMDALQALDVTPVYSLTEDTYAWRDAEWAAKIETVDKATRNDPVNFEGIAASDPDLIIAIGALWEQADYDKLSDIAPVLDTAEQAESPWRDTQTLIGDTLDLGAAADAAVAEADQAIDAVAAEHPEFAGKTITIGNDYGPEYGLSYFTASGGIAEGIMTDLGFAPNPLAADFVKDDVVSEENLAKLDADVLVMTYGEPAWREDRESKPLFQSIPAVKDGRLVSLATEDDPAKLVDAEGKEYDNPTWMLRAGASAESLPWGVEIVADQWLADVKFS
ncbi:ABC transporter substrate-binding protein [Kineosporia babensis]|uniref:ABC transporter substrate-binding protein n=1 Tax=Kineosporia babensis TaxID=499548 RepID=A0A9X1SWL8_9ACTN|nr:ABC transporter substrate-binding protein [Kineosporia babensis]MCD5314889.1 ABC transporter substrate-binding protein [Kineosporia babensis]